MKTKSDMTSWMTLQLHQRETATIANVPQAVGRNLTSVFCQSQQPAQQDDDIQGVASVITFICCSLMCPYHANVMKIFETTNRPIVYNPFILFPTLSFSTTKVNKIIGTDKGTSGLSDGTEDECISAERPKTCTSHSPSVQFRHRQCKNV